MTAITDKKLRDNGGEWRWEEKTQNGGGKRNNKIPASIPLSKCNQMIRLKHKLGWFKKFQLMINLCSFS